MTLIDTHCHLESPQLSANLPDILAGAKAAGITTLITNAITPQQWPQSLALAHAHPQIRPALGIHPWYIDTASEAVLAQLPGYCAQGAIAIGEIGLDRKITQTDFPLQVRIFEHQLAIARELNLPVIIHCRGAFDTLLGSLRRIPPRAGGIAHNFSGTEEIIRQLIPHGIAAGISGPITYRNSPKKKRALQAAYPDYIVLETDAPDLPPVEAPEKPNVPANIVYNLRAAAHVLERTQEEIAAITTKNATRILRLEP